MLAVEHITFCQQCDEEVFPSEVYKVTEIAGSPKHYALAYECEHCGFRGKAVAVKDDWLDIQHRATQRKASFKRHLRMAEIEVAAVEGVDDLRRLWATLPPPLREEIMHSCKCKECVRKLYGEG